MSFPNYTIAECVEQIQTIEAQIARLLKLATRFTVDKKRFEYDGQIAELRSERAVWAARYGALQGSTSNPFQGPRIIPV